MNQLEHKGEFEALLENYQLSEAAKESLRQTKLVILVAPTGIGRNTIINALVSSGKYSFIVSDTTREPRVNDGVLEQHGNEYWFRSEDGMLEDIKNGQFLEAAVIHNQQVSGISIRELQKATDADRIAINEIEPVGAHNIWKLKPDTEFIFVLPPSFEAWQQRLAGRGKMDPDEYKRRMQSSIFEFGVALERPYYKFIVNDSVEHAVAQITDIVERGVVDDVAQQQHRQLVETLLQASEQAVDSL
jgi:guanylate kinase